MVLFFWLWNCRLFTEKHEKGAWGNKKEPSYISFVVVTWNITHTKKFKTHIKHFIKYLNQCFEQGFSKNLEIFSAERVSFVKFDAKKVCENKNGCPYLTTHNWYTVCAHNCYISWCTENRDIPHANVVSLLPGIRPW